jgi:hypothetical protein
MLFKDITQLVIPQKLTQTSFGRSKTSVKYISNRGERLIPFMRVIFMRTDENIHKLIQVCR